MNNKLNCKTNSLIIEVFEILKKLNFKIGFAESCTAGLISSSLGRLSGASEVFDTGIITYSNRSKIQQLNVKPETLNAFGAVSKETAIEMAKGLISIANLDLALSITGIAGPTGATIDKPIGLVYICILSKDNYSVIKCNFTGDRYSIQDQATQRSYYEIKNFLTNTLT